MIRILFLFQLIIAIMALTMIPAQGAQVAQIVVPVTLTYQGKSVTATLAVDTGASVTTIDQRLAARLGIAPGWHGGLAQMADGRAVRYQMAIMDVAAATMHREALEVNIMDYSANREADGMLGLNFLSGMTMTIDWQHKRIYWSE